MYTTRVRILSQLARFCLLYSKRPWYNTWHEVSHTYSDSQCCAQWHAHMRVLHLSTLYENLVTHPKSCRHGRASSIPNFNIHSCRGGGQIPPSLVIWGLQIIVYFNLGCNGFYQRLHKSSCPQTSRCNGHFCSPCLLMNGSSTLLVSLNLAQRSGRQANIGFRSEYP